MSVSPIKNKSHVNLKPRFKNILMGTEGCRLTVEQAFFPIVISIINVSLQLQQYLVIAALKKMDQELQ